MQLSMRKSVMAPTTVLTGPQHHRLSNSPFSSRIIHGYSQSHDDLQKRRGACLPFSTCARPAAILPAFPTTSSPLSSGSMLSTCAMATMASAATTKRLYHSNAMNTEHNNYDDNPPPPPPPPSSSSYSDGGSSRFLSVFLLVGLLSIGTTLSFLQQQEQDSKQRRHQRLQFEEQLSFLGRDDDFEDEDDDADSDGSATSADGDKKKGNKKQQPLYQLEHTNTWKTIKRKADNMVRILRSSYTVIYICLDYWINLQMSNLEGIERELRKREIHRRSARRLTAAFIKNGGIYIKAGQTIASMNNILPAEWTEEMAKCQDQCFGKGMNAVRRVFTEEFGLPPEAYFSEFDSKPIAAASLAQVHRARLKNGQEVAVKVQYPGVRGRLADDVRNIARFVNLVEWWFPDFQFGWLLDEFEETLPNELDFIKEARNNERTTENFKSRHDIATPKIHWDLTSSRILTMEFVRGCKVNDLDALKELKADPRHVSRILSEVFSEQIFRFGFVHCDPHPGNVLVRRHKPEENRSWWQRLLSFFTPKRDDIELVLLDHGLYREITEDFRMDYCQLWKAIVIMDEKNLIKYAEKLGIRNAYQLFASLLTSRQWDQNNKLLRKDITEDEKRQLKKLTFENIGGIVEVLASLPRQMLLLLKANDLLRSVQYDLKVPLVYFSIMARHAQQCINENRVQKAHGAWNKTVAYTKSVYSTMSLNLTIVYYTVVLYSMLFFSKNFGWSPSSSNLLMNKIKIIFES